MGKATVMRAVNARLALRIWSVGAKGVCVLAAALTGLGSALLWPTAPLPAGLWGLLGGAAAGALWSRPMLPLAAQAGRRFRRLGAAWGLLAGLAAAALANAGMTGSLLLAGRTAPAAIPLAWSFPAAALAGCLAGLLSALALQPRRDCRGRTVA